MCSVSCKPNIQSKNLKDDNKLEQINLSNALLWIKSQLKLNEKDELKISEPDMLLLGKLWGTKKLDNRDIMFSRSAFISCLKSGIQFRYFGQALMIKCEKENYSWVIELLSICWEAARYDWFNEVSKCFMISMKCRFPFELYNQCMNDEVNLENSYITRNMDGTVTFEDGYEPGSIFNELDTRVIFYVLYLIVTNKLGLIDMIIYDLIKESNSRDFNDNILIPFKIYMKNPIHGKESVRRLCNIYLTDKSYIASARFSNEIYDMVSKYI